MPKDLSDTFMSGTTPQKKPDEVQNLDKINSIMEKGMGILDKIISLKKYRDEQQGNNLSPTQTIETKAHKEAEKIIQNKQLQIPQQKNLIRTNKTDEAVDFLMDTLEELKKEAGDLTLNDLIEKKLKPLKENGILFVGVEDFLNKNVECRLE